MELITSEKYQKNLFRLQEIEEKVKDPNVALREIDSLIDETKKLVAECYRYTRGLRSKVEALETFNPDEEEEE